MPTGGMLRTGDEIRLAVDFHNHAERPQPCEYSDNHVKRRGPNVCSGRSLSRKQSTPLKIAVASMSRYDQSDIRHWSRSRNSLIILWDCIEFLINIVDYSAAIGALQCGFLGFSIRCSAIFARWTRQEELHPAARIGITTLGLASLSVWLWPLRQALLACLPCAWPALRGPHLQPWRRNLIARIASSLEGMT